MGKHRTATQTPYPAVSVKIDPHRTNALHDLDHATLRALWMDLFGHAPPLRARTSLLIDCLAYRLQEQAFGGLSLSTRSRLRQLATDVSEGKKPHLLFQSTIKSGTRLVRAWGGQTHEVQVMGEAFLYRDQCYTNLSAIARVITGSRWSGPRFFGIHQPADSSHKEHHGS